jgi:hypothetical protein
MPTSTRLHDCGNAGRLNGGFWEAQQAVRTGDISPIPLKKPGAGAFGGAPRRMRAGVLAGQAFAILAVGMISAIFRRFWAAAARWNSSLAPICRAEQVEAGR